MEDMAYFCMDFRKNLGRPFEPPYPPTVARYTDNYILMLSSSKIFSYAGQRMALACVSDKLFDKHYEALANRYGDSGNFRTDVYCLYPLYDYERLHNLDSICLCRDVAGGM